MNPPHRLPPIGGGPTQPQQQQQPGIWSIPQNPAYQHQGISYPPPEGFFPGQPLPTQYPGQPVPNQYPGYPHQVPPSYPFPPGGGHVYPPPPGYHQGASFGQYPGAHQQHWQRRRKSSGDSSGVFGGSRRGSADTGCCKICCCCLAGYCAFTMCSELLSSILCCLCNSMGD